MRRTRVALVITRMMAGAGGVALRGAQALDPDEYDVTVIAGSGDRQLQEAEQSGFEVRRFPLLRPEIAPREDRQALHELTDVLAAGAFDVVHTHSAKAGAIGRLAAVRADVPRIVHTFHGFPFHEFQSPVRRGTYVAIERWLGRRTHAFLAVGSSVAAEAVRRGLAAPERIRTIGAAVDTDIRVRTPATRAAGRRLLDLPPGIRVVGTVGRLDYQKDPRSFLAAIARLDREDVLGVWVGDGPLRAEVTALSRRWGLTDRMLWLGDRRDVPALLPAFDVFAMSSRYEGLPCAVVEAMTSGVPVVATAVNAVPDVVVPGETGLLVPPESPAALAVAVDHLLRSPVEARRMAATARQRLGTRFAPATLGAVLDHTYRSGAVRGVRPASALRNTEEVPA